MNKEYIKCGSCKYWISILTCEEPKWKYCSHPKCGWSFNNPPDGFGVVDGEPYNEGSFASGPEFGCIHGELKE